MARTWWSSSDWPSASGRGWQDGQDDSGWGRGWWASPWGEGNAQQAKQQTAVAAPDRAGAGERADAETQDEEAAGRRTMPATAAELDPPGAEALDLCVAAAAPVGNDDAKAGPASSNAPGAAVAARAASSCAPPQTPAPPPPQTPAPPPPVAEGQVIFAITDFQTLEPGYHWSRHNLALKNIRQWVWDGDLPAVADFSNHIEFFLYQLVEKPGPDIEFDLTKDQVPWRWQEMIAQLDADSVEFDVNGPGGTSGGVVGCSFCRAHNSYDHKMSYLQEKTKG